MLKGKTKVNHPLLDDPLEVTVRLLPGKRGREIIAAVDAAERPEDIVSDAVAEVVLAVDHPDIDPGTPLAERVQYLPPEAGMPLVLLALGIRADAAGK